MVGTAGLFETQAPSLVLKSKTNQNKLNVLMVEMETINNEIINFFMVVDYGPGYIENPIIKMVLRSYFSLQRVNIIFIR